MIGHKRTTVLLIALLTPLPASAGQSGYVVRDPDTRIPRGGCSRAPVSASPYIIPRAVVVDTAGTLFIAAFRKHRILAVVTSGEVSVVAGTGSYGFAGDGGPATSALLAIPHGLAVDPAGNLYIADSGNNRVRRIDASTQTITTVAGNGTSKFGGDGGLAMSAGMSPSDVALDSPGNLFIVDFNNNRIRRVDLGTGIITTVAGNGKQGFGGDSGPAVRARLNNPSGVEADGSGNIYIADSGNNRIRRVDAATGIIRTVAGNSNWKFSGDGGPATEAGLSPSRVAVGADGDLFIADQLNQRIRRVDATTGVITTVAGNGDRGFGGDGRLATSACLAMPFDVAVDRADNVFIADQFNLRIRRIAAETGIITTVAEPSGSSSGMSPLHSDPRFQDLLPRLNFPE